ncbi:EamA family transporter [Microbulbifer sp. VTAC004]|uniref:EamA family transporter n=1 Tax=Microbulbifer sp. VTAC004 TaxID=3243386 RepID=UPI00403A500C
MFCITCKTFHKYPENYWVISGNPGCSLDRLQEKYGCINTGPKPGASWIFLSGAISLSLYNPLVKRVHSDEPTEVMAYWVILFGALWLLFFTLPLLGTINWQNTSFQLNGSLLYLALFTTLVSFFLLQFDTVKIGPTKVAAYGFLNPIFVLALTLLLEMSEFSSSFFQVLFWSS